MGIKYINIQDEVPSDNISFVPLLTFGNSGKVFKVLKYKKNYWL